MHTILVTLILTLTSGLLLGFSCLEHITYITANFPQMCLMLDQFLCGHLSRVCDISCLYVSFFQCLVCLQLIVLV